MNKKYQNTIGERIRALRINKGLTQKELADIPTLRVQRNLVNYWENDERDIKSGQIIVLADYFNTTCDYILRGISPENVDVSRQLGLSDGMVELLKRLNSPLDIDEYEKARIITKQKAFENSVQDKLLNIKEPLDEKLTEEEFQKFKDILQDETNKQILSILNDSFTALTGRGWETYGLLIFNAIYNYCRIELEPIRYEHIDKMGLTSFRHIKTDELRQMFLLGFNETLEKLREALKKEDNQT